SLAKRRGTASLKTTANSPKIFYKIIILTPAAKVNSESKFIFDGDFYSWIINLLFPSDPITEGPDPEPIDPSKCEPCKCGLTNKHHRIVGGQETEVNQYPWM
ncbi:hypothetical protein L9F63_027878, partial [Diploptera punctata]